MPGIGWKLSLRQGLSATETQILDNGATETLIIDPALNLSFLGQSVEGGLKDAFL
jgi:hypothetical protein